MSSVQALLRALTGSPQISVTNWDDELRCNMSRCNRSTFHQESWISHELILPCVCQSPKWAVTLISHKRTMKKKPLRVVPCGYWGSKAREGQGRAETEWPSITTSSDTPLGRINLRKGSFPALRHSRRNTTATKQGLCLGSNPNWIYPVLSVKHF